MSSGLNWFTDVTLICIVVLPLILILLLLMESRNERDD